MAYKYNKTIMNGAEKLIDGIENIEMFLDDNDDWNFHDSEIYSFHWDRDKREFVASIELIGCAFPRHAHNGYAFLYSKGKPLGLPWGRDY